MNTTPQNGTTALAVREETAPVSAAMQAPAAFAPTSLGEAMQLAKLMSDAKLVPQHLQGKPADCLLVIEQAARWGMSPFAVAQATSVIQGKLMYEGKLVSAVINARGDLAERLRFEYSGAGKDRAVKVIGRLRGETEPRTIEVRQADAATNNKVWQTQPDQQLAYHGARVWARRHMPELMLGVYAPEEFEPEQRRGGPAGGRVQDVTPVPHDPHTGEVSPPPSNEVTPQQMKALMAALNELGYGGNAAEAREARLRWCSDRLGRPIETAKDLTGDEASALIQKARAAIEESKAARERELPDDDQADAS